MTKKLEKSGIHPDQPTNISEKLAELSRVAIAAVIALGIAGTAFELMGGYTSQTAEVIWLSSDLEKLLDLEKYLKENGKEIVDELKYADSDNLWPTVKLLKEVREKVGIADESLSTVGESDIRLNSSLVQRAIRSINKILMELTGGRNIKRLHKNAGRFRNSKDGFGIIDAIGSAMVDTDAVIACSHQAAALAKDLRSLKKTLRSITGETGEDMSNNEVLNFYLDLRR